MNFKRILSAFLTLLLSASLPPLGYTAGEYRQYQEANDEYGRLDKQIDESVGRQVGDRESFSGELDFWEAKQAAIKNSPELQKLEAQKSAAARRVSELSDALDLKNRPDNLVYDLGAGNRTRADLTPEEIEMLQGESWRLSESQRKILREEGITGGPSAKDFTKELTGDIKKEWQGRGLGDKEPVKDEIQEDLFQAVDYYSDALQATMGRGRSSADGSPSSTSGIDSRSMQQPGMGQSMPTSGPMGGGEGHHHGPSGKDM